MIPVFRPYYDQREEEAVAEVLRSGWIGLGPKTEEFEQRFAERAGTTYAVALNSCTAALHIALQIAGVSPGDEVLVPTLTFVSTGMAANYLGAAPVFCDVRRDTLCLDYDDAARRRTYLTKAVVPVLYGGQPIDEPDLDVPVVYDAAHAAGSDWDASGKLTCWSFHAVKNLAVGDGGMITTDDEQAYRRALRLRWLGIDKSTWDRTAVDAQYWWEYRVEEVGYKSHLNDIAAAIGLVQLAKLDEMNAIRRTLVRQYLEELDGVPGVEMPAYDEASSWHLLVARVDHRDELSLYLRDRGISTGVHYKPVHLYPLYNKYELPVAEEEWRRLLTLPLFPALTSSDVSMICTAVREGVAELSRG